MLQVVDMFGVLRIVRCRCMVVACGVFTLKCGKGHEDIFETGTRHMAEEGDERTRRYQEATFAIIGTIFAGGGEIGYQEVCRALGMHGFSESTNSRYFWRLYHAAETLMQEPVEKSHERAKELGQWLSIVGLFDGAWLHRGYASQHGSSAIVDYRIGCILFMNHKSKDKSHFDRKPHEMSSGMMEVTGLGEMLDEAAGMGAKFSLMVADVC